MNQFYHSQKLHKLDKKQGCLPSFNVILKFCRIPSTCFTQCYAGMGLKDKKCNPICPASGDAMRTCKQNVILRINVPHHQCITTRPHCIEQCILSLLPINSLHLGEATQKIDRFITRLFQSVEIIEVHEIISNL